MTIMNFEFVIFNFKKSIRTAAVLLAAVCAGCASDCRCEGQMANQPIIAEGAELVEVSNELAFTEGPANDRAGNIYFTDQPNDRIMLYTTDGRLETFMQPAGRSNGMYFDYDGSLLSCADGNNELWRINVATKQHTVLTGAFEDKRLNGPNDVWAAPGGNLYFTDPFYKRDWWKHTEPPHAVEGVYLLRPGGQPVRVADDLVKPNGIVGTPDGKTLYVADIRGNKTYAYDIQADGTLANKRLFCELGSDGMTIDCAGNVYLTGRGVTVFSPAGQQIEHIDVPQRWTANITFGGKDNKTLFITASTAVYTLQMNVCGGRSF